MMMSLNLIPRKKGKHIQVFSDNCSSCLLHIDNVEIGKCAGCKLEVWQINDTLTQSRIKKYEITVHPTTIIDDEIKVEGIPKFLWMCGDEFYEKLKHEYPLKLNNTLV
jgi:hypothetical protein